MKGRYEKGFLSVQENYDDPGKLHELKQSVSYLSKNLTKSLNPLPDYNTVKPNLPSYSIPKGLRFEQDKILETPGPSEYFHNQLTELQTKPGSVKQLAYIIFFKLKFRMGNAKRYKDFQYADVPGPGMYKISGFTDNLIRDVGKKEDAKNKAYLKKRLSQLEMDGNMGNVMDLMNNMEKIDEGVSRMENDISGGELSERS